MAIDWLLNCLGSASDMFCENTNKWVELTNLKKSNQNIHKFHYNTVGWNASANLQRTDWSHNALALVSGSS